MAMVRNDMNQLTRFGIVLGVICLAATLVLAVTYEATKPKIEKALKDEEQAALKSILPQADSFLAKKADEIEYFEALKDKNLIGYCIKVTGSGYNGFIKMIAGIDTNGVIKGVRILENQETPGMGSRINEVKRGDKEPWFLKQFIGKQARSIEVKKNIDAVAGATISSMAVTNSIRKTVEEFLTKIKGA